MAGQSPAGQASTPLGRWNAPGLPGGVGDLHAGMAGVWMLLLGPPWVAGGPPRTMWVDGQRLVFTAVPPPPRADAAGPTP
eukprot:9018975-Alexandrium_andersonii.AAC.1